MLEKISLSVGIVSFKTSPVKGERTVGPVIYVKVYRVRGEVLLAACDEELLGRTLREGELKLEVKESFYGGELVEEEALADLLMSATIANLVGSRCVGRAVELGYVDEGRVLNIEGVPHAQVAKLMW